MTGYHANHSEGYFRCQGTSQIPGNHVDHTLGGLCQEEDVATITLNAHRTYCRQSTDGYITWAAYCTSVLCLHSQFLLICQAATSSRLLLPPEIWTKRQYLEDAMIQCPLDTCHGQMLTIQRGRRRKRKDIRHSDIQME